MPSVRFARDKRGYEYVYLVHTSARRGKPGRSRMLYWYRTPPGVRVGRQPFDEEVQRTLEQQYPAIDFDWNTIVNTPMPPPDMTEYWRERRRAEKAARQERRALEADEAGAPEGGVEAAPGPVMPTEGAEGVVVDPAAEPSADNPETALESADAAGPDAAATEQSPRKRRRRRGGRRRRGTSADGPIAAAADGSSEPVDANPTSDGEEDEPGGDDPSETPDPSSEGE